MTKAIFIDIAHFLKFIKTIFKLNFLLKTFNKL